MAYFIVLFILFVVFAGFVYWIYNILAFLQSRSRGEPISHVRKALLGVTTMAYGGAIVYFAWKSIPRYKYRLDVELRAPAAVQFDDKSKSFLDIPGANRKWAFLDKLKNPQGEPAICLQCFFLPKQVDGCVYVVPMPDGQYQVFRPLIPKKPSATEWTNWMQPDYVEDATKDDSILLQESRDHERGPLPPHCIEIRYRLVRVRDWGWNSAHDTCEFVFELRASKTLEIDSKTQLSLVTERSASGSVLRAAKRREEGEFQMFQLSFLMHSDRRRAVIVHPSGDPAQVFVLSIPQKPIPADWSQWQSPAYVATGDAAWDFMNDQGKSKRSTEIPPDCFELRYRIEKWEPD